MIVYAMMAAVLVVAPRRTVRAGLTCCKLPRLPIIAFCSRLLIAAALSCRCSSAPMAIKFTTRVDGAGDLRASLDFLIGITGWSASATRCSSGSAPTSSISLSPEAAAANALVVFPLAMLLVGRAAARDRLARRADARLLLHHGDARVRRDDATRSSTRRAIAGGSDGAYINVKPALEIGGRMLLDFEHRLSFYYFCLALLVIDLRRVCSRSRAGRSAACCKAFAGTRRASARSASTPIRTSSRASRIAGAIAGFAGALYRGDRRLCDAGSLRLAAVRPRHHDGRARRRRHAVRRDPRRARSTPGLRRC